MHISDEVGLERNKCDNIDVNLLKYMLRWKGHGFPREWKQNAGVVFVQLVKGKQLEHDPNKLYNEYLKKTL